MEIFKYIKESTEGKKEEKTNTINQHKDKRIDAQYYMKVDQEIKIRVMLQEAKIFVIYAKTSNAEKNRKDITAFIVDRDTPGFKIA